MKTQKAKGKGQRAKGWVLCSALGNEKGIALALVLVLSLIALGIMTGLIYMLTSGTQVSGVQKRYKTTLEAARGGNDVAFKIVDLTNDATFSAKITALINTFNSASITTPNSCTVANTTYTLLDGKKCSDHINDCTAMSYPGLCVKLTVPASCWSNCDSSFTVNPGSATTFDMKFDIGTDPVYTVYTKIVDRTDGNSGPSTSSLISSGVVSDQGGIPVVSYPYLYTIEVDAEKKRTDAEIAANPSASERAKLSVLYQY